MHPQVTLEECSVTHICLEFTSKNVWLIASNTWVKNVKILTRVYVNHFSWNKWLNDLFRYSTKRQLFPAKISVVISMTRLSGYVFRSIRSFQSIRKWTRGRVLYLGKRSRNQVKWRSKWQSFYPTCNQTSLNWRFFIVHPPITISATDAI